MLELLVVIVRGLALACRGHRELVLENLALRQQLTALRRTTKRAPLHWLHRDRDNVYGDVFRRRLTGMGIAEVVSAPASPWQNPYVERLIGSVRRECLDHVIILNEAHLRRVLTKYSEYYHRSRTHLGLAKDAPDHRPVSEISTGPIVVIPEVGGLHHRYERRAA